MFDVGRTELLLVVVVALVVIGPKDLPKAMRFVGKWVAKARGMKVQAFTVTLETPEGKQDISCADDTYVLDAAEVRSRSHRV